MLLLNLRIRFCLSALLLLFVSCDNNLEQGFEKIPSRLNTTEDLIRGIAPDKDYKYWVCIRQDFNITRHSKNEIVTGHGNDSYMMNIKFDQPKNGFKNEMWRGYYYIAYMEGDTVKIVRNEEQLVRFIGKINSIEESLLIADIKGLSVDYDRAIGCSYKKTKNGYEFYLAKFHKCFVKTEPFRVSIDTLGNYKAKSLGFFYNDENICLD